MAWTMQEHYEHLIIPSIQAHMESYDNPSEAADWLYDRFADAFYKEDLSDWRIQREHAEKMHDMVDMGSVMEAIANKVCEHRLTTNGAHEVYLGDIDCVSIPWCTDEYAEQWWANQ